MVTVLLALAAATTGSAAGQRPHGRRLAQWPQQHPDRAAAADYSADYSPGPLRAHEYEYDDYTATAIGTGR